MQFRKAVSAELGPPQALPASYSESSLLPVSGLWAVISNIFQSGKPRIRDSPNSCCYQEATPALQLFVSDREARIFGELILQGELSPEEGQHLFVAAEQKRDIAGLEPRTPLAQPTPGALREHTGKGYAGPPQGCRERQGGLGEAGIREAERGFLTACVYCMGGKGPTSCVGRTMSLRA